MSVSLRLRRRDLLPAGRDAHLHAAAAFEIGGHIVRDVLMDEQKRAFPEQGDVAQRLAPDAQSHQRPEDIPMSGRAVARVPIHAQTTNGKRKCFRAVRVKPRHAALRALIAAVKGHFAAGKVGRGATGNFHGRFKKARIRGRAGMRRAQRQFPQALFLHLHAQ